MKEGLHFDLRDSLQHFVAEDLGPNYPEIPGHLNKKVSWELRFKTAGMVVCGLPIAEAVFKLADAQFAFPPELTSLEGRVLTEAKAMRFIGDFNTGLLLERVVLNLLHRASSVATTTRRLVQIIAENNSSTVLLDTRKTMPGLKFLDKYAVRCGGGQNHRYNLSDLIMIKDNQKKFFGNIFEAFNYYHGCKDFYRQIQVEIHSLAEFKEILGDPRINLVMLDNFTPDQIHQACKLKPPYMKIEISGGIQESNLKDYLIPGVDAISSGTLTQNPVPVDISMKVM